MYRMKRSCSSFRALALSSICDCVNSSIPFLGLLVDVFYVVHALCYPFSIVLPWRVPFHPLSDPTIHRPGQKFMGFAWTYSEADERHRVIWTTPSRNKGYWRSSLHGYCTEWGEARMEQNGSLHPPRRCGWFDPTSEGSVQTKPRRSWIVGSSHGYHQTQVETSCIQQKKQEDEANDHIYSARLKQARLNRKRRMEEFVASQRRISGGSMLSPKARVFIPGISQSSTVVPPSIDWITYSRQFPAL